MADALSLLVAKRDGRTHTEGELRWLIDNLSQIPDYQLSAWLMACVCRGMAESEATWLTDAMARSGDVLDLSDVPGPRLDKHSTGGVGDKVTLVLAPLVAAVGGTMAKLSGRGLAHTGGTIDKLESVPGFSADLDPTAFKNQLRKIHVAIAGQSARLAPADGRLYALRDVTGTVENPGLICASILSKKIAAGADTILLDVKVGSGAFIPSEAEALSLAKLMQAVGRNLGRTVVCAISEMNQPLGRAVGNALEVAEALEVLDGGGPVDLRELSLSLAAILTAAGGLAPNVNAARLELEKALVTGAAKTKFVELVGAQGGDVRVLEGSGRLPMAPIQSVLESRDSGFIKAINARVVGEAASLLGAGRRLVGERLDHAAGIWLARKIGEAVDPGDPLAILHTSDTVRLEAARVCLKEAFEVCEAPVAPPSLIKAVLGIGSVSRVEVGA